MLTDENERIISWNKYTEKILGMKKKELYKKPVSSFYPDLEWRKIRKENIRQKGMQHHLETKMKDKKGDLIDVDISVSVLKDDEKNVIGSIGIIRDISDRKKMQKKLSFEHGLLTSLLDNVPDSIYFKDKDNKFIMVNKTKAEHCNTIPAEMIGKSDFDYMDEERAKKAEEIDNQVLKTGNPIINDVERYRTDDGADRWVSVTKIPRYDESKNIIGTMGISRDITNHMHETKETEKYKKVAIGQNLRMIELRDKVKDLISEMEKKDK